MIGPDPIIINFLRSLRLAIEEFPEQEPGVVRTWPGFGMELHRRYGQLLVPYSFHGPVIHIDPGNLNASHAHVGNCVAVILRRYVYSVFPEIFDTVV